MSASIRFRVVRGVDEGATGIRRVVLETHDQEQDDYLGNPHVARAEFDVHAGHDSSSVFQQGSVVQAIFTEAP